MQAQPFFVILARNRFEPESEWRVVCVQLTPEDAQAVLGRLEEQRDRYLQAREPIDQERVREVERWHQQHPGWAGAAEERRDEAQRTWRAQERVHADQLRALLDELDIMDRNFPWVSSHAAPEYTIEVTTDTPRTPTFIKSSDLADYAYDT